jgi:hypothetical protein
MSTIFDIGRGTTRDADRQSGKTRGARERAGSWDVTFSEKGNWVVLLVTPVALVIYLASILPAMQGKAIADVDFAGPMIVNIVFFIVANILGNIGAAITNPAEADKTDQRDKEIERHGERVGNSIVMIGAIAALFLAMARQDYFWIANAIYMAGLAAAVLASITKIAAYHGPFQRW